MNPKANITEAQLGGRLLPRSTIESNTTALVSTFQKMIAQGVAISGISMNISRVVAPLSSANPAWRDAIVSLVIGTYVFPYTARQSTANWYQTVQLYKPCTGPEGSVVDDRFPDAEPRRAQPGCWGVSQRGRLANARLARAFLRWALPGTGICEVQIRP